MHAAFKPFAWVALQAMLVVLGLGSMLWNGVALVLYPLLPRATGLRVGRAAIARGYALYWWFADLTGMLHLRATALDALAGEPGLIVVANHPSMLDALMLVAHLPRSACVMKASLVRNPFLGPGARLARYIRNDTPAGLVRLAVDDLRAGGQLVLFPEGTRTTNWPLEPFRPGFTLIAKLAGAPIQTVFIDTDSPYLGKGWPLFRLPPLPIEFSVRLGRRFEPTDDPVALLAEIESYFRAGVRTPAWACR
ncbi:MAG: lysophospholipid acyltransferase family protein [Rubrivivax sp.]